ncbi:dynein light chain Tctex-type protein 2B-like [Hyperolius riggenbachi]|uniref:dynein light chain Tctex-type protein 2B-like n=1 Tax=Hyperolius riggenbachi TaxID=752182 RepID=UPI0035A2AF81
MDATNQSKKLAAVKLSRVTFKATNRDVEAATVKEPAGTLISRGVPNVKSPPNEASSKVKDVKKAPPPISLRGLLACQRFGMELKSRVALKRRSRSRTPNRKPIPIINEQVPAGSANPAQRFPYGQVKELIQDFLTARLKNVTYNPETSGDLTKGLCEDIKKMVRRYAPPRYKLICNLAIGSKGREDILMASQCLWDSYSDNVTSCSYQNLSMFCVVTVYAVYCE